MSINNKMLVSTADAEKETLRWQRRLDAGTNVIGLDDAARCFGKHSPSLA